MATKTISIDLLAYERLSRARSHEKESFSRVIRRALWPNASTTGRTLLASLESLPTLPPEILKDLEEDQALDHPPADKWR
jgi:hypothetical protein